MVPEKILRFLQHQGNIALAGFRDRALKPFGTRVPGWTLSDGGTRMTALLPATIQPRIVEALEENGEISITIEEMPLHETYQVKGRYVRRRPVTAAEAALADATRDRLINSVRQMVPNEEPLKMLRASIPAAAFAVEFEVREIFVQTPGPAAGSRVYPQA